jgi:Ca2+-binding EF-hand superfamily protein
LFLACLLLLPVPLLAYTAFGTNEQRLLQAIYAAMDDGNEGWISFSQFVSALSTIYRGDKDDVLSFWFKM